MVKIEIRSEIPKTQQLGRADWLRAALLCLIKDGIASVQITRLATYLGVSRGSFYWHFKTRQELLNSLLKEWSIVNGQSVTKVLNQANSLDRGVLSFFAVWTHSDNFSSALEQAVRDWARLDTDVLKTVRKEDTKRILAITAMFERFEYAPQEANVRARILYFAQVGYLAMNPDEAMEERMLLLDDYFFAFTGRALDSMVELSFRNDWIAFSKVNPSEGNSNAS